MIVFGYHLVPHANALSPFQTTTPIRKGLLTNILRLSVLHKMGSNIFCHQPYKIKFFFSMRKQRR